MPGATAVESGTTRRAAATVSGGGTPPLADAIRAVEDLAASDVPPATFFRRLLALSVEPLAARAAVVWRLNADGLLSGECESGLDSLGGSRQWIGGPPHIKLLDEALGSGQPLVRQAAADPAAEFTLVVARFEVDGRPAGVIEFVLDDAGDRAPLIDETQLSLVEELASHAGRFLTWRQEADSTAKQIEFWASLNELTARLHRSLRSAEVAATAVNDARPLLGVDRVSLAVAWGRGCRMLAISGQDRVNRRANLVRSLTALAGEVLHGGEELTYTGRVDEFPPQVERLLTDYLAHSGSRMVRLIPLFPPDAPEAAAAPAAPAAVAPPRPLGVLILEQIAEGWLSPLDAERAGRLAEHVAGALANARSHEGLFLLPLWRMLGAGWGRLRGRRLALLAAVLSLVAAIAGGLCFIPADYRVEAAGRLMPCAKRAVFTPWDGEVVELFVRSEQRVARNQPLLRLRNDELHAQLLAARNKLEEKRKALTSLEAELDEVNRRASAQFQYEATRLRGRLAQTRTEITGAEDRVRSLEQQVELLTVRAPIAGTVTAFQLEELLLNRPVQRGEVLLEVMDESGPWQIELDVPEFRMGHILDARHPAPATPAHTPTHTHAHAAAAADLPVQFVLATHPEQRFAGRLRDVSTRAGLSETGGTVVSARVDIDADALPGRTIGAEVQAKISCGQRSLAYVLFGDVVEFFRRRFW
ncbi:MAG TPA: hypothetical protein VML55_22840 [Planctomycetaceae bacterium]|nr:hypothetical protein [Planctomycetaceae bacterium]